MQNPTYPRLSLVALLACWSLASAADNLDTQQLIGMDLPDLMNIEIELGSRAPRRISDSATAATVLTSADIRRTGALTLTEVLRYIPGLYVFEVNNNTTVVGSRNVGGVYANNLLVLIDGRSVYSQLHSGVYWDMQDLPLEDIERIEVVRGPGAALWGANAVDGIINVITQHAGRTRGTLVSGALGNELQGYGLVRQGGRLGERGDYRAYFKYVNRDSGITLNEPTLIKGGEEAWDDYKRIATGFRLDWDDPHSNRFTLQGDLQNGWSDNARTAGHGGPEIIRTEFVGADLRFSWNRHSDDGDDYQLTAWYDYTHRGPNKGDSIDEKLHSLEIDFQHDFDLSTQSNIVWGLGYRQRRDHIRASEAFALNPARQQEDLVNGFIQYERLLTASGDLRLTLGSKLELYDYEQLEIQPTARLLWNPLPHHTLWGALTRAVRKPSRIETNVEIELFGPYVLKGNPGLDAETARVYELGYRFHPSPRFSLDVTAHQTRYGKLVSSEDFDMSDTVMDTINLHGEMLSRGIEIAASWQPSPQWRLSADYAWHETSRHPEDRDNTPSHQFKIWSRWNIHHRWSLDAMLQHVDRIDEVYVTADAFTRLDLRLGWQVSPALELSLVGQNLLDRRHQEYASSSPHGTELQRGVYAKAVWQF